MAENDSADFGDVNSLVQDTLSQLNKIWDKIGSSQQERDSESSNFIDQLQSLCTERVIQEENLLAEYRKQIDDLQESIHLTSQRLGEADPSPIVETAPDGGRVKDWLLTDQVVHLEKILNSSKKREAAKLEKLHVLKTTASEICHIMTEPLGDDWTADSFNEDLSNESLQAFTLKVEESKQSLAARMQVVEELVMKCQDNMEQLRVDPATELDQKILGALDSSGRLQVRVFGDVGSKTIDEIRSRSKVFGDEATARFKELSDVGDKIAEICEILEVPFEEQDDFQNSVNDLGLTREAIQAGKDRLQELNSRKMDRMTELIQERRAQIVELQNDMGTVSLAEEEEEEVQSEEGDDTLKALDVQILDLRSKLEALQPLLETKKKYDKAVLLRVKLDEASKDPDRLRRRGSALLLKEEEKMGRQVKKIPEQVEVLKRCALEWEAENGIFRFNGERYIDTLEQTESHWKSRNKKDSKSMGGGVTPKKSKSRLHSTSTPRRELGDVTEMHRNSSC